MRYADIMLKQPYELRIEGMHNFGLLQVFATSPKFKQLWRAKFWGFCYLMVIMQMSRVGNFRVYLRVGSGLINAIESFQEKWCGRESAESLHHKCFYSLNGRTTIE